MRTYWKGAVVFCAAVLGFNVSNSSWIFGPPGRPMLVTHLGLAQQFDERGLSLYGCKADRMLPPTNPYLENTVPAVARAFALGAAVADVDVQPTSDGQFVVFHDWGVDCRTDGHGTTRDLPLRTLKRLDIGFGYTADKGRTYPFRGKFVGAMPTLAEMLATFPDRRFMLVIKSNDSSEADLLLAYLRRERADLNRVQIVAGERPAARLHDLAPTLRVASEESEKACLIRYLAIGWTGTVPASCRNSVVTVPVNYRKLVWGWPNLFVRRMARVNSVVLLSGTYEQHSDKPGMNFIDTRDQLAAVPRNYAGHIFTDRIDVVGPAARETGMLH